jgi:hypothetical protein
MLATLSLVVRHMPLQAGGRPYIRKGPLIEQPHLNVIYRLHDNRHTCGSYLAVAGYTLAQITELLNHKTLEMAKRYSLLADECHEKLSFHMSEDFIAGAVDMLRRVSEIEHPSVSQATVNLVAPLEKGKPRLYRVK